MKMRLMMVLMVGLLAPLAQAAENQTPFKDDRAKASYAVGVNMGNQMKREKMDLDPEMILKGIKETRRTSRPDGPGGARHVDQLYPATPQRARRGEQSRRAKISGGKQEQGRGQDAGSNPARREEVRAAIQSAGGRQGRLAEIERRGDGELSRHAG